MLCFIPIVQLSILRNLQYNYCILITIIYISIMCSSALSCKCGDEFQLYYTETKANQNKYKYSLCNEYVYRYSIMNLFLFSFIRWYCHFDDDIYVNTRQLQHLLSPLNYSDDHYLGRWSVGRSTRIKVYIYIHTHTYIYTHGHHYTAIPSTF